MSTTTGSVAAGAVAPTPVVLGEALVDLVVTPQGQITASLGGAPYNVARTMARLGCAVGFAGAVSTDQFGGQIIEALRTDGVNTAAVDRCDQPTTLAIAHLDASGSASYHFYTEGTSVPGYQPPADLGHGGVLVTGGLALTLEPLADRVLAAVRGAELAVVDLNCRPSAVDDWTTYLGRIMRVIGSATVLKVSDDDLAVVWPGRPVDVCVDDLVERGASLVIVTSGAGPVIARYRSNKAITVPVPRVRVVDTIGAGDAFVGGFVTFLSDVLAAGCTRDELFSDPQMLTEGLAAAAEVAAANCTRRGADPPHRDTLSSRWVR
jgi:fructokinase